MTTTNKKVLITGILGQDGANMAEYLLKEPNLEVYGMMRRTSNANFGNIESFKEHPRFRLVCGDLTDEVSIDKLVEEIKPDYFINFGANSFVGCSWDMPLQVFDVNTLGVIRSLEAIRKFKPDCRFYSAGSSEELGDIDYSPQDINHPIKPRSPYGASKAAARHLVKVYRESYNIFAVHSILFNHEGIRRGEEFVTRKISHGAAKIKLGLEKKLALGKLDAKRDWGHAKDFVEAMWMMLQQKKPDDFVIATGKQHSVREFAKLAFSVVGLNYKKYIVIDKNLFRPSEVHTLLGNYSKARRVLGWRPKTSFKNLVKDMVETDIKFIKKSGY